MKSEFFGRLSLDHIEGEWWKMREPLGYYSAKYDLTSCTPAGIVIDLASVKRWPIIYLLAGGTGNWESAIHDGHYRFGVPKRWVSDQIFYESGRVRASQRSVQTLRKRAWRLFRTSMMTAGVIVAGWIDYGPLPGCLDYRGRKKCHQVCRIDSEKCENYYPNWRQCVLPGYRPDILEMHGG